MRGRTGLAPRIVVITLFALTRVAEAALSVPGNAVDTGTVTVGDNATVNASISTNNPAGDTLDHFDTTGGDCNRFTLTPGRTLPTLITPATAMNIAVRFDPTVRGLVSCTVTMRDSVNASLGSFVVRGTGQAQQASATTPPSFGSLRVANAAVLTSTQDVTITNNGDPGFSLQIQAMSTTNDYALVSPPALPVTLAQGASLVVTVRFDPTVAGLRKGTLDIMSDDPVAALLSVDLSGNGTAAQISVDNQAFGIVTLQQTVTRTITVSNAITIDQGPLLVTSASIAGGAGWFTFDTNGAFGCAGGTTCTLGPTGTNVPPNLGVVVRCTPPAGASGQMTADVNFASDTDSGGDASSQITCIAGRADASVAPTTLAFADTRVGQTSAAKTVTVTNTGNQTLTFTATPSGAQALAYIFSDCSAASCSVAPNGGTKTFDVSFAPLSDVQSNIQIDIDSNDPDDPSIPITVTGKGIAPRITAPASLPFGNVEVPQTSAPLPLTVMNSGSATLTISNAAFGGATPGAYAATSGTIGAQTTTVAPGNSTTWTITCDPVQQGANSATFVISSDALGTPTTTVDLTCNGTQGVLVVNPTSIDFGGVPQGTSVTRAYTLRNTGNLAVNTITGVLDNATLGYSLDPTTPVPSTLSPGQQVSLNVIFAPQNGTAGGPANVAFSGSFGAVPTATNATLSLDGDGLTAGFDVTPATLAFGDVRFDQTKSLTFCIVNTDQSPVTIQDPIAIAPDVATTMTGEFTVSRIRRQNTCGTAGTDVALPQTLTPGQANQILEVTILADPADRTGVMAATVTVTSDLAMNPTRTVTLTGTSTSGILTLTPGATVDFGAVDVQGPPAQRTLTIKNSGDAAVQLSNFARTPNNPNFTFTLPSGTTTLQPNQQVDIAMTYAPVDARAAGSEETFTITHATSGAIGAPPLATVLVQGRGIDRVFTVAETPTFPDTFRNPGPAAPVRPVRVTNTGEASLRISAVMVTNDPQVWQLVNADPIDLPGGASVDFPVRFAPVTGGRADAMIEFTHDAFDAPMTGPTTTTRVNLTGNGLARNVLFAPRDIDLGFTGIGLPVSLADALTVTSMDAANTFTIKEIRLVDDAGVFAIDNAPVGVELSPSQIQRFAVTFTPTVEGEFTATAELLLDDDPTPQSTITIKGRAVFADARGGGGCSTGSGGAGLLPIALALLVRRRRRLAALALVALAVPASADNLTLSTFDPTPATSTSGFHLQGADVGSDGEWVAFAMLSHAADPLVLDAFVNGQFVNDDRVVARSTMLELGGAYAFLERFEAGLRMPLYLQGGDALGDSGRMFTTEPASGTARGDLTLHAKVRFWRQKIGAGGISAAGAFAVTLPTATDGAFTGNDKPSARLVGLGTYVPNVLDGRITLNGNLGFVLRDRAQFANIEQKSGVAFGAGASMRVLERLWLATEVFGDISPGGRTRSSTGGGKAVLAPTEWLGGVRLRVDRTLDLGIALGRGLTSAAGSPALRGVLTVSFTPNAPEPRPLGGEHVAGPDVDTDGDGIFDRKDKCPNEPEDHDLFEDSDGCPDPDNDKDGILDAVDRCPNDPEDKDGFKDDDGCPDPDNDGDGILDAQDRCPNEPEDKDGFKDDDGCPDPDNDGDGIPDAQDKCPNEPETINGNNDNDGCPDAGDPVVIVSPDHLEFLDPIQFKGVKFDRSHNVLGQVGAMMRAHGEIVRLRISVHIHPSGNPTADQELSEKRANALKEWLVQWGVAEKRLEARGFGSEQPLVPKDQPNALSMNERVELIILEKK